MGIKNTLFMFIYLVVIAGLFWVWRPEDTGGMPGSSQGVTYRARIDGTQAAPGVSPDLPAAVVVTAKKKVRRNNAASTSANIIAIGGEEKIGERRQKRVSRLREPGEAMGGGVDLNTAAATTASKQQKK